MPGILAFKLPQNFFTMAKTNKKTSKGGKAKSLTTIKITTTARSGADLVKNVK